MVFNLATKNSIIDSQVVLILVLFAMSNTCSESDTKNIF